ncbi:MAG: pyruvate, phosphate dikinase, partial [Clostridia bacterium]|nr:pyruvate, phosphate dikinase [Clostridia bacterium]
MTKKYLYLFSEGNENMRAILGGKGANLAEMTNLGMPVPRGFTVSTEACNKYYEDGETIAPEIIESVYEYMGKMEKMTGKQFGSAENPLLVSVRSGARASMPGMMDTILNLGLNDVVVEGRAKLTGNPRFAYDSYRRFIQMFSDVVMGLPKSQFEVIIDKLKVERNKHFDIELDEKDMRRLVREFKNFYLANMGEEFPQEPKKQLIEAIKAVFRSWNNERAIIYRRKNDIPSSWGTAVNVQEMVFGNMGPTSGTGVAFTRDPSTGEKKLYGEFLMNAQGEDVVAGIRTPQPISELATTIPDAYKQFVEIAQTLENHYKDMQDMEFTVENGKLFMLQTRNGNRTAAAALRIAVDLVDEGMITEDEAVMKVEPRQLDALLHPQFDTISLMQATPVSSGLAASPGAACGRVYFTAAEAKAAHAKGQKVILVRLETSPEDIEGMYASEGILTGRGGKTSHAAVVARGMGCCCVAGCGALKINEREKYFILDDHVVHEGDYISIDGSTGNIYIDVIKTVPATISGDFARFMSWADARRRLKVRTNADNPKDAAQALNFGAEGVGLCRTEHMFFNGDRIKAMREMIVASNSEQRKKALDKLLPMQRSDFEGIFRAMNGYPVTIRFLDPPLHEFLPNDDKDIKELALDMGITYDDLKAKVVSLHETNPMMGHRGCRLAVSFPEIYEMQTRAVIEAAINVNRTLGMAI